MKKLIAMMMVLALALCAVSASADGVLEKIQSAGKIVMGTEAT